MSQQLQELKEKAEEEGVEAGKSRNQNADKMVIKTVVQINICSFSDDEIINWSWKITPIDVGKLTITVAQLDMLLFQYITKCIEEAEKPWCWEEKVLVLDYWDILVWKNPSNVMRKQIFCFLIKVQGAETRSLQSECNLLECFISVGKDNVIGLIKHQGQYTLNGCFTILSQTQK